MKDLAAKELNAPDAKAAQEEPPPPVECGLIMPISATDSHDEKHWASVQTLLHRGIKSAGMAPSNVWEGVNDRISKRIVSNIFRQEIVVADISDLNPNVMLELGLRLASKKPTVVVFNKGGRIPFDIADIEALPYPADLNILEMEAFFEEFSTLLKSRLEAYRADTYQPYLSDVVVEVLEPQIKEVSIGAMVLERIDELGNRLSRMERAASSRSSSSVGLPPWRHGGFIYVWVPEEHATEFKGSLSPLTSSVAEYPLNGRSYFKVGLPGGSRTASFQSELARRLDVFGGDVGATDEAVGVLNLIA